MIIHAFVMRIGDANIFIKRNKTNWKIEAVKARNVTHPFILRYLKYWHSCGKDKKSKTFRSLYNHDCKHGSLWLVRVVACFPLAPHICHREAINLMELETKLTQWYFFQTMLINLPGRVCEIQLFLWPVATA